MESQAELVSLDAASSPFEGRWNRLISTTNWEKGLIVFQWRTALKLADAPATEYSDEAWSRRVGGVTGQHVGRLRRVYERFGEVHEQFDGLYWSHFQASLDWDDAEMWLEGAVQNRWSVSLMRKTRWEALGAPEELQPRDEDIVAAELNEDIDTSDSFSPSAESGFDNEPRSAAGPDFGDEDDAKDSAVSPFDEDQVEYQDVDAGGAEAQDSVSHVKPFEHLPDLPEDVAEAFEMFKMAILRHKAESWNLFSCDDLLATLDSLKQLALAPA